MKYLKSRKVFEQNSDESIKDDIKDIFIDLTDNYLDVEVDHSYGSLDPNRLYRSKVEISKYRDPFLLDFRNLTDSEFNIDSDIIDSILRFIDYLKSNNLYLNEIIIYRIIIKDVRGLKRLSEDYLTVSNITEEGLFTNNINNNTDRYESELVTEPVNKIIIKYSNKNL
jgi:hypothetical protein